MRVVIGFMLGVLVGYGVKSEMPQMPLSALGRQADAGYCALVFEGYIKRDLTEAEIRYCKKLIGVLQKTEGVKNGYHGQVVFGP